MKTQTKKSTVTARKKPQKRKVDMDSQPLEMLLTPAEYEAITAANYSHPESRIILRLFLHVNYFWHVSRYMQGTPSPIKSIDWKKLELTAGQLIRNTFQDLLPGVQTSAWEANIPEKRKRI